MSGNFILGHSSLHHTHGAETLIFCKPWHVVRTVYVEVNVFSTTFKRRGGCIFRGADYFLPEKCIICPKIIYHQ